MELISNKKVKIRKDRKCWGCLRIYKPGEEMEVVTCKDDGKFNRAYWCEQCSDFMNTLELWEKEDGFAEGDLLNYDDYEKSI